LINNAFVSCNKDEFFRALMSAWYQAIIHQQCSHALNEWRPVNSPLFSRTAGNHPSWWLLAVRGCAMALNAHQQDDAAYVIKASQGHIQCRSFNGPAAGEAV
jgi:hypothetical protein